MSDLQNIFSVAKEASLEASKVVLSYAVKGFLVNEKSPANLVTEADVKTEEVIIETIKKHFPDHTFMGEETVKADRKDSNLWVIDPIDGTNNFAHGIPHVGISIAYCHNGIPMVGIVYQPFSGEFFSAVRGEGAYLNETQKLSVSKVEKIQEAVIASGFHYDFGVDSVHGLKTIELLMKNPCHGILRFGAASLDLCFVAASRFDAYYEFQLSPWDFAAGGLIVREAGGVATNIEGENLSLEDSKLIVGNAKLVEKVRGFIIEAGENLP